MLEKSPRGMSPETVSGFESFIPAWYWSVSCPRIARACPEFNRRLSAWQARLDNMDASRITRTGELRFETASIWRDCGWRQPSRWSCFAADLMPHNNLALSVSGAIMMNHQQPVNRSLTNCPVLHRQSSLILGSLISRAFGLQTV